MREASVLHRKQLQRDPDVGPAAHAQVERDMELDVVFSPRQKHACTCASVPCEKADERTAAVIVPPFPMRPNASYVRLFTSARVLPPKGDKFRK